MCHERHRRFLFMGIDDILMMSLLALTFILTACAGGGNYGRLIGARESYNPMRKGPIGADYRYYKTPETNPPNAIIAVHEEYSLDDPRDDWTPMDSDSGSSLQWKINTEDTGHDPLLLEIQGPDGQHIGLWYSFSTSTVVKVLSNNRVEIYPPEVAASRDDRGRR